MAQTKQLSVSSAPLTSYLNKPYYDLKATVYIMKMLAEEHVVDGFEFQLLAEWNPNYPPLDKDTRYDRQLEWENSRKYTEEQIADLLGGYGFTILSVHANRDIGICLCSTDEKLRKRGRELIERALVLTERLSAPVCVFHLWDTWLAEIDFEAIKRDITSLASEHPEVKASVENLPTYITDTTPFEIVRKYEWVTLDTKWADMYDELDKFDTIKEKLANIHVSGTYRGGRWLLTDSHVKFEQTLVKARELWEASRLLTIEPSGEFNDVKWKNLVAGIRLFRE